MFVLVIIFVLVEQLKEGMVLKVVEFVKFCFDELGLVQPMAATASHIAFTEIRTTIPRITNLVKINDDEFVDEIV